MQIQMIFDFESKTKEEDNDVTCNSRVKHQLLPLNKDRIMFIVY